MKRGAYIVAAAVLALALWAPAVALAGDGEEGLAGGEAQVAAGEAASGTSDAADAVGDTAVAAEAADAANAVDVAAAGGSAGDGLAVAADAGSAAGDMAVVDAADERVYDQVKSEANTDDAVRCATLEAGAAAVFDAAGQSSGKPAARNALESPLVPLADASEHFHATITTNRDIYTSGETAQVRIRYTLDQESVAAGDFVIVAMPPDIAVKATFSVSKQHFSAVEDLGDGRYKLVFGDDAATGLSGSMSVYVSLRSDTETTGAITAGDGSATVTVVPAGGGESGVGVYADEAIMKDGLGNENMAFGGYDYSQEEPAQIGLFDSSVDQEFTYRLFINRKNVAMTGVVVTDVLPDGMQFANGGRVACYKIDAASMTRTDELLANAVVRVSGQRLTVELGSIDCPVEIEYAVFVPAQTSVQLRNHAEVSYTQGGKTHKEQRDYIAQSSDYSASNGVKSVDKTVISNAPGDQWVTYTIKFWNDNSFAAGEICLTDDLDDHVKFLYSDDNEYFALTVDEHDPSVLHITNVKDIPASTQVYETFVCDFSGVPVGYTVRNTTGGNTTVTEKVEAAARIGATKTVDGAAPEDGESFAFCLMDSEKRIVQQAMSGEGGAVAFASIQYDLEDMGKTFTYYLREVFDAEDGAYEYDSSEFEVRVSVGEVADERGVVPVQVRYFKDGAQADGAIFDNKKAEEKPDEPDVPDVSDKPDEPDKPDTPDAPTTSAAPDAPRIPRTSDDAPLAAATLLACTSGALLVARKVVKHRNI